MKSLTSILAVAALTGVTCSAAGANLVDQSFDQLLFGDDPTYSIHFYLTYDPNVPVNLRLDAQFENLSTEQTGVRYFLRWFMPNGSLEDSPTKDFVPLAGSGETLAFFDRTIDFTPSSVSLYVEGGGPTDNFKFVGDLDVTQIPEPACLPFLGAITLFALNRRRKA